MAYEWYISPESYLIAEKNGIANTTLEQRVRGMGWDIERATTTPPQPRKDYGKWINIAVKNGITRKAYIQRIKRGWGRKRAAKEPMRSKADNGKIFGEKRRIYPRKFIELAKKNGICYSTFKWRMLRGWTLEEASQIKIISKSEAGKKRKEGVRI